MHHQIHRLSITLILLALLGALPAGPAQAAGCFPRAAPAIADCISGTIGQFWQQNGGLPVFGYPIGPEQASVGSPTAQLFERARLELHPENSAPYQVLLGRLGADALARQGRDWNALPKADPAAGHYFAETGHAIASQFWPFWFRHGLEFDRKQGISFNESLALFGLPLTEASAETSPTDGKQYLTQWFERARFEFHPENAGTPHQVLLGLLGRELQAGATAAPENMQPGGFIQAAGGQLTRLGQPVLLKGVNYYPQWRPWSEMWQAWDGAQIARELGAARADLGINVVRVLLPYNITGKRDDNGKITSELLARVHELVQIAGKLDMRVLITLFDFYHDFPAAGSSDEARNIAYLRALLPQFAADERVLGWDLHNEPDQYEAWRGGYSGEVLSWLGRMADLAHQLAPNQLVTVGMSNHSNLWLAGPDGRRPIDYSDLVSMHTYDAGAVGRELDELRAQTAKPILVEEFGWPSGPACVENYSEQTQLGLYRSVLGAARERGVGVVAWSLRDFDAAKTVRWDSREEYFGLYRADGSLKPAAQELRALAAPPLPSTTSSDLPLSTTNPQFPNSPRSPMLVPGSGHTVKNAFRRAWELFGGQESFGLPLTEAFERPSDGVVVQYFENAVLELHSELGGDPRVTPEPEQISRVLRPLRLGANAAAERGLPEAGQPPQGALLDFYNRINGTWRLGRPISGELPAQINGRQATVQYFENGRLELDLASQTVAISPLGKQAWDAQCLAAQGR